MATRRNPRALAGCAALVWAAGHAAEPEPGITTLTPVVVTATPVGQPSFDLPLAIDALERSRIQDGQAQVNLSESLVRVPGVTVQNRHNYAQDLQISSRGFGARSTFGVRGLRLMADGIPASMPDGQGQASTFDLGSAGRIEVLRGPYSVLYGNASGGVIQVFTEDAPAQPTATSSLWAGSYDSYRAGLKFGGRSPDLEGVGSFSSFSTSGYRDHSAARREHFNGKLVSSLTEQTRLTLVANVFSQPRSQDPMGLTAAQVAADPRQASAQALQFNSRKRVMQIQVGATVEQRWNAENSVRLTAYYGTRDVEQFLAVPVAAQLAPTSGGGVIELDRRFGGLDARWIRTSDLLQRPLAFTAGVSYERMAEQRRGFQNFIGTRLGVKGELRRDEDDTVRSADAYAQADWQLARRWSVSGGVRRSEVKFDSRDSFIVPGNGDDSGGVSYRNTNLAAGVVYHLTSLVNLYASAGSGFETPTFNELAHRSTDGSATGLNFGLRPSRSRHYEVGVKALAAGVGVNLALFQARTRDEIAVLSNSGGRSVFQNAGNTRRRGAELGAEWEPAPGLRLSGAATWLDAVYRDSFLTCSGAGCTVPDTLVPAGNRLPGVPRTALYGELEWRHAASGFGTALEARWVDRVPVNDVNSEAAASYAIANWRVGLRQRGTGWVTEQFLRVDNLLDKRYVGSVIVNEANGRYFEPSPRRNVLLGVRLSYSF